MKKNTLLKVVNPLLALSFFAQAVTGLSISLFIESIPYEPFEAIHEIGGYTMIALVLIHLILNWNWVKNSLLKRAK
jgi:hypothetical protein